MYKIIDNKRSVRKHYTESLIGGRQSPWKRLRMRSSISRPARTDLPGDAQ